MTKRTFSIVMIVSFVIGVGIILFFTDLYAKQIPYRPDAVITIHNDTTGKNTQAYAIGKMQVYIDETYRMEMPLWALFVKAEGMKNNGGHFDEISDTGNEELSMVRDNPANDANPFIVKLKVKNISKAPISILASNFKIRQPDGTIYVPDMNWQSVLAKAGFFSGVDSQREIAPNEEKVLYLVYATPTGQQQAGNVYQEYIQINYDSDSDLFATKVAFPFNYTVDYEVGTFGMERKERFDAGIFALMAWLAICGAVYYRKKNDMLDD